MAVAHDVSDALNAVAARVEQLESRVTHLEQWKNDQDEWRNGHTEACQAIVAFEVDRLAQYLHGQKRSERLLRRIWGSDPSLRPPGD